MRILDVVDKLAGALTKVVFNLPVLTTTSLSSFLLPIDSLVQGKWLRGALGIVFSPFYAAFILATGLYQSGKFGWSNGFVQEAKSAPTRLAHFFREELLFGMKEKEDPNKIFWSPQNPRGLQELMGTGFFGRLTTKLFSLSVPMELYLNYGNIIVSPHNDISVHFTRENLKKLTHKYPELTEEQHQQTLAAIYSFLRNKRFEATQKLTFSQDNGASPGRIESLKQELEYIKTSIRCVKRFEKENVIDDVLNFNPLHALNYVWLAITNESKDTESELALKNKLIMALFNIQRGYSISQGASIDLPECPTGAIGLAVRTITDETEHMPHSDYSAADPTPANISLAVQTQLNEPFVSTHRLLSKIEVDRYNQNPQNYKEEKKSVIKETLKYAYSEFLVPKPHELSAPLSEATIDEVVDAGVEAWEPPVPTPAPGR